MIRIVLLLLILLPRTAQASPGMCGPRIEVIGRLLGFYHEKLIWEGVNSNGNILELYANDSPPSWTLTLTSPNGRTCLINAGQSWNSLIQQSWQLRAGLRHE